MFQLAVCVGWAVALAVGLAVVYGLYENNNGHPVSTDVAALYNALNRIAWGAAVCWVIFACATGYGGEIHDDVNRKLRTFYYAIELTQNSSLMKHAL